MFISLLSAHPELSKLVLPKLSEDASLIHAAHAILKRDEHGLIHVLDSKELLVPENSKPHSPFFDALLQGFISPRCLAIRKCFRS